jgi:hypothetical protein
MRMVAGVMTISVGDYELPVEYKGEWINDGIGAYEFWGAKCYDHGINYVQIEDIIPLFTDETSEQRSEIKSLINDNFEDYAEEIAERVEAADVQEGDDDNS